MPHFFAPLLGCGPHKSWTSGLHWWRFKWNRFCDRSAHLATLQKQPWPKKHQKQIEKVSKNTALEEPVLAWTRPPDDPFGTDSGYPFLGSGSQGASRRGRQNVPKPIQNMPKNHDGAIQKCSRKGAGHLVTNRRPCRPFKNSPGQREPRNA